MTSDQRRLYWQEVEELTGLLRGDPACEALRRALRRRRVSPDVARLAAFYEDESGVEYGALVTDDGRATRPPVTYAGVAGPDG